MSGFKFEFVGRPIREVTKDDVWQAIHACMMGAATVTQIKMIGRLLNSHIVLTDVPGEHQEDLFEVIDYPMVLSIPRHHDGTEHDKLSVVFDQLRKITEKCNVTIVTGAQRNYLTDVEKQQNSKRTIASSEPPDCICGDSRIGGACANPNCECTHKKAGSDSLPLFSVEQVDEISQPVQDIRKMDFSRKVPTCKGGYVAPIQVMAALPDPIEFLIDGVVNDEFITELKSKCEGIIIDFLPSHDFTVQECEVHIPGVPGMLIQGRKGSC
jgi:hypothetical protein